MYILSYIIKNESIRFYYVISYVILYDFSKYYDVME
jgi:hypothetical protein